MGYIEDLRDKCLEEFKPQLEEAKEKNPDDFLFQTDFSVVSFSCGFIEGWKTIHELNRLIKAIQKIKRQIVTRINKKCSNLDLGTEQWNALSDKEKRNFKKDIKHALWGITDELSEKIKKLKKIKCDILLRIGNVFLYILSALLSFGVGALLYLNNIVVNAIVYSISIIAMLGFVAIQVIYTVKYLKAIKSTIRGIIDFSIKRTFSTLLMVWWYVAILTFVNNWNTDIITYSFSAIFILNVVFVIYDLFLSSTFFDEYESTLSLIAAITIGFVMFADSFNHPLVSQIGSIFQLFACLLLSMLIVKKFLIDKQSIKTMLGMMYFIFIAFLTVLLTIFALYKLFWVTPEEGQVADNTLFSAVMGIYAAILGGGLTLAGVAWTIKHGAQSRKDEERKKLQPLFNFVNRNLYQKTDATKLTYIHGGELISGCNELKESQTESYIESFDMENTSKTEFFISGIYINNVLYKTNTKELIKKEHTIKFDFDQVCFHLDTINDIKLCVEDLIENKYTMELEFSISNHIVTIKGNKSLQLVEKTNE